MEAHALALRVAPGERAEQRERLRRVGLVEPADGDGHLRLGVARRERGGRLELAERRDRAAEALQRDAVEQAGALVAGAGVPLQERELRRRREPRQPGGRREARHERGQAAREVGVQEVAGADGVRRVGLDAPSGGPRRLRARVVAAPEQAEAVVQLHERLARVLARQRAESREAAWPGGERGADPRLQRRVAGEDRRRLLPPCRRRRASRPGGGRPPPGRCGRRGRARAAEAPSGPAAAWAASSAWRG